jgi:hypothetical protein
MSTAKVLEHVLFGQRQRAFHTHTGWSDATKRKADARAPLW